MIAARRSLVVVAVLVVAGLVIGLTLSHLGANQAALTTRGTAQAGGRANRDGRTLTEPSRASPRPTEVRVATLSLTLREPSSPTIANGHSGTGAPLRILPAKVRFPVGARSSGTAADEALPLIVFSQGFDESDAAYAGLLDAWARAGYVVAAPTYPFTDPSRRAELNESDIVNHPADLRFVISALVRRARSPDSPLHAVLDPNRVAVAGQSDGGDVSLAVAANTCCRDGMVRAAVILSGAELTSFGGTYFSGGSVPLLVTQGSRDTINPPGCSAQLYDQAPQPKFYLNISGAQHLPPYVSSGSIRFGVERATIAFLNAYLKAGPSSIAALRSAAKLPPQEDLTSGSTAPPPPSQYCPGAP